MKASDSDVPDLVEKLDNLGEAWECVRYIKRSSEDIPENMRIELVTADEEIGVTLDFPDFRGESFRNIISQNQPKTIDDWCEHADSLLFILILITLRTKAIKRRLWKMIFYEIV
jgi:hypothetical protein